ARRSVRARWPDPLARQRSAGVRKAPDRWLARPGAAHQVTSAPTRRRTRSTLASASGAAPDMPPSDVAPGRVVLLHGLWMPGAVMHWLATRIEDAGFAAETFSYHSVAEGPERAARELVAHIGERECALVAHSLGGLVALQ